MPNMPPISHYKDEPVNQDATTQSIIENEIDKEVEETTTKMKVLPVETASKPAPKAKTNSNPSNIVNIFKQKMSTSTTTVELPSIGRTIEFKEINTSFQKELSQVSIEHNSRADIMYISMLSLINRLAAEKGFDVRELSEFERIAITMNLQQSNKMNTEIKYTCQSCGKENSYKLDVTKLLKKFNKSYRGDVDVTMESGNRTFKFVIGWPKVALVEDFFKSYYRKYDNASKAYQETTDKLSQIEYITMFIKSITMTENSDPEDSITANLEELTYGERVQIIDSLPQHIVFDETNGIVAQIIEMYVTPMNDCFKYNDCAFCGAEQDAAMASLSDFMGG